MTIWKLLSMLLLVCPLATLILGLLCWRFPPKGPTWAFGYRSRRARASDESWQFAQRLAGRIWSCLGLALVICALFVCNSLLDLMLEGQVRRTLLWLALQILCLVLAACAVELTLVRKFDRFGRPKHSDPEETI